MRDVLGQHRIWFVFMINMLMEKSKSMLNCSKIYEGCFRATSDMVCFHDQHVDGKEQKYCILLTKPIRSITISGLLFLLGNLWGWFNCNNCYFIFHSVDPT